MEYRAMEDKKQAMRVPVAYLEEFHEREVNNNDIFTIRSETPEYKLFLELPHLDPLLKAHSMDDTVNKLVAGHGIRRFNPAYRPIFEGAQRCVQCIVDNISAVVGESSFDVIEAGSAFEELKVGDTLEFDFMLCERSKSWATGIEAINNNTLLEGQFKNLIIQRIYERLDNIRFPYGWSLYRPASDNEELEQKYKPVDFYAHPSCQMHKRGTKIWFDYLGKNTILIDVVPCKMLDQDTQETLRCCYRGVVSSELSRSARILSFCYDTLDSMDEETLQAHMNNISTSILEKKMVLGWPKHVRKLLRVVKFYCQDHGLISSDPRKLVSGNKAYMESYVLKTLFIRTILELKAKGIKQSQLESVSPSRFLCYFVGQIHSLLAKCESMCCGDVEAEYYIRFYHCFIDEKYLKRVSVKWTASDFQKLSEKCNQLLEKFDESSDEAQEGQGRNIPCQIGGKAGRPLEQVDYWSQSQEASLKLKEFDYSSAFKTSKVPKPLSDNAKEKEQVLGPLVGNGKSKTRRLTKKKQKPLGTLTHKQGQWVSNCSLQQEAMSVVNISIKPTYADALKNRVR